MADRRRSKDGSRDTEKVLGDTKTPAPADQGRAGGNLQRKVGTRDEEKQARERPTTTRVRKDDERDKTPREDR
jgi:hypothetical protein